MGGGRTDLKIVFFGTPEYVLPILTAIHKKFVTGPGKSPIVAVVTQSPKPAGRKQILTYSPVDKWAHGHKIPIFYKSADLLKENIEAELGICASFGEIISGAVIEKFKFGILNIHPSLLPRYRGASPIPASIANGDKVTGVTIIKMDEKVDHGPIISQFEEDIQPDDNAGTLRARLFERSAEVVATLIEPYMQGKIVPRTQNDGEATFTKIATRQSGFIDLKKTKPDDSERFIRAMHPWPGAWTLTDGKRLKLLKAHLDNGKLILDEVQLEGKNPVSFKQFKEAHPNADVAG